MLNPKVSVCLRVKGRPIRTKRMLNCLRKQTMSNIELIAIGDNCPEFQKLLSSDWFKSWKRDFRYFNGNEIFAMNCISEHPNDWGAKVTNIAIKVARGHYFMFLDNDDMILPEHVQFYYDSIIHSGADFAYNDVWILNSDVSQSWNRKSRLESGWVGHAELIVRTEFLKKMAPHQSVYGQDWILIQEMMAKGKSVKGNAPFPTYHVMSSPNAPEPEFRYKDY